MNKRTTGTKYEEIASEYLIRKGHRILCRNYRIRTGEIDLITKDGHYIVFCEVKYRRTLEKGYGYEAVGYYKQQRIVRTAQHYLLTNGYSEDTPCRFDVLSILGDEITHIENAFEV